MNHRCIASLSLALLLVLSGCFGMFSGDGTPTETGGPATPTGAAFEYPAGYDETGVVDSSAATRAHTEGIIEYESFRTSYRATVETPNRTVQVNVTQSVKPAERRALRETNIGPREQAEYYANGTVYVRTDLPGSNTSYDSRQQPLNLRSVSAKRFVGPVIANVTYGEATRVNRGGEQLVRYESRSLTSTSGLFGENVSMADVFEFSATILVGGDGVVRHAEYGATVDRPEGERTITVAIDVTDINSTTVRRPNWVDQAASS